MGRTVHLRSRRKEKRSYSLSRESVAFLEALRKKQHATSTSSVLEAILRMVRHAQQRQDLERAVRGYYSSLSAEEMDEQVRWGEFAMREFPQEVA